MESVWTRYLKWCTTKSGKNVCNKIFIALNIGTFSAVYLPHTFHLKDYQKFMELYKDGKPVPVPENLKSLFEEVEDDLDIHKIDRKLIKPFMCFGFDTFQAGISGMRSGGIIGIPINFTYKTARDLEASRLLINNAPVDWSRQETEDLAQALVLSPDAKKFAIAREILTFEEFSKLWDCIAATVLFVSSYAFSQWMKYKFNMYKKSLSSRVLLYTVAGFGGVGLYFMQKDFFRKRTERIVDEKLAQAGPTYVKGGHEFYSKLLARNIAHRALLDKHGHELFTEEGDLAYFIREKTTPFTKRKSRFESMIKEFMKEQEKSLDSDLTKIAGDVEQA
ncbi:transmembrane protein 177 isoform X2 [Belonocnema kinseyi]|nr:transmembrane protein 177 isoform X2 [Belonocnema kinseyi]XP_033217090.1 transmembrane protein 177 isoform X2 [Belonocnema kinseyi]